MNRLSHSTIGSGLQSVPTLECATSRNLQARGLRSQFDFDVQGVRFSCPKGKWRKKGRAKIGYHQRSRCIARRRHPFIVEGKDEPGFPITLVRFDESICLWRPATRRSSSTHDWWHLKKKFDPLAGKFYYVSKAEMMHQYSRSNSYCDLTQTQTSRDEKLGWNSHKTK